MKRTIASIALLCVLAWNPVHAQFYGTGSGVDYTNVLNCGAVGDGVANDVAALRTCWANVQANTTHHTMYFPGKQFKIQLGNHLDTNFTLDSGTHPSATYFVFPVTTDGAAWICDPAAQLNVTVTNMSDFQALFAGPYDSAYLLGSTPLRNNFRIAGNCHVNWRMASGVTLLTTPGNQNAWGFMRGTFVNSTFENLTLGGDGDAGTVTGCTNATPMVVSYTGSYSFPVGESVTIQDVLGNTACNGRFTISAVGAGTMTLQYCSTSGCSNAAGNGAYTSGGSIVGSANGFPIGLTIFGSYQDTNIKKYTFNSYVNLQILNYGGSDNDAFMFSNGESKFIGGRFRCGRSLCGAGLYTASPEFLVQGVTFDGQSKLGIELNVGGGTLTHGITVADSYFINQKGGIISIGVTNSSTTCSELRFVNNAFSGTTAVGQLANLAIRVAGCVNGDTLISGNTISNYGTGVSIDVGSTDVIISNTRCINTDTCVSALATSKRVSIDKVEVYGTSTGAAVAQFLLNGTDISLSNVVASNLVWNFAELNGTGIHVSHVKVLTPTTNIAFLGVATNVIIEDADVSVTGQSFNVTGGANWTVRNSTLKGTRSLFTAAMTGPCRFAGNVWDTTNADADVDLACPNTVLAHEKYLHIPVTVTGVIRAESVDFAGKIDTTAPAFATPYTPNAGLYRIHRIGTLTGALTVNAPTNPYDGATLEFYFTQDATGGRLITWNAAFKILAWSPQVNANGLSSISFRYNGTNWVQLSPQTTGTRGFWSCNGAVTSSATLFMTNPQAACTAATEAVGSTILVYPGSAGTIRNLRVTLSTNAVNNTVFTVRTGAVDTIVTCTVLAGTGGCSDTTNAVAYAGVGGNQLTVKFVTGAAETFTYAAVSFEY